ncbi:hypothetical protein THITH_11075 [Thioalkalivibrio paradoxus ARh 1]|uniref:Uncharacterized protein n=1 Tax=Thioalkalivibrio paradoxus ARh 1 TaxID=713585 RepID=W0DP04_9GAMM|nr:hypothetical protein THITH_11075 [Thioalkalivibrio paradoxus ARh 1]
MVNGGLILYWFGVGLQKEKFAGLTMSLLMLSFARAEIFHVLAYMAMDLSWHTKLNKGLVQGQFHI